ncbi:278_t:CDS:2, partial [Entrophospora sp. SA101]
FVALEFSLVVVLIIELIFFTNDFVQEFINGSSVDMYLMPNAGDNEHTEDIKCAHTFLSFYQKDKGNLLAATHHARNLLEYGGTAKEEAKRLLHIINSLKGNDIV